MQALVLVLMAPLMLLNFFGGIGSGIWLAALGEWWAIGYGLLGLLSHFLLGIIMVPSLLFAGPAVLLVGKGKIFLAIPFLLLSQLYTYAVITAWAMFVFYFFMSEASRDTFWPLLIWSYGVALGPWMYMAQKEQQGGTGDGSVMTTFFAQVAYIIVALVVIFGSATLIDLAAIFGAIMLIGMLIQTGIALTVLKEEKRFRTS